MGFRRRYLGRDVFGEALDRMLKLYSDGQRVVVSISGGKDSAVCMEICRLAARMTGRLPVEAMHRDDEIMQPGTFEYLERVAADPEIQLTHWFSREPCAYVFSRECPYFWPFDPTVPAEQWVRQPPPFAIEVQEDLRFFVSTTRYPPAEGKRLYDVLGLRAEESLMRLRGVYTTRGYITGVDKVGARRARPIYDWTDADVWKAIRDNGWDYNRGYDVMHALGFPRSRLRVSSFGITWATIAQYPAQARAWPDWAARVEARLPMAAEVARHGLKMVTPDHKRGESWKTTFLRECVEQAPPWIAERARFLSAAVVRRHQLHSASPLSDDVDCEFCLVPDPRSWKSMVNALYMGDPWGYTRLARVSPEVFRPGTWWSYKREGIG